MELWSKLTHEPFKLSARIISDKVSFPQDGALCESYVERQDVAIAAKAVGDALRITRIAE
jgi:hypothetical protein